jgi:hypothetical protein
VEDVMGDPSKFERKAKITLQGGEASRRPPMDHRAVDSGRERGVGQNEGLYRDAWLLRQQPE